MIAAITKGVSNALTIAKETTISMQKPAVITRVYFPKRLKRAIALMIVIYSTLKEVSSISPAPFRSFGVHKTEEIIHII